MAGHNRLTQKEIDEICLAYTKTNNEIETARITHHSSTTISKYLKRNGLARGSGGNQDKQIKITDAQLLEAVKTMTRQQIADKYGVHIVTIDRRMKKLHVHAVYLGNKCHAGDMSKHPNVIRGNTWHWAAGAAEMVKKQQNGRFELVEFKKSRLRIRCTTCGFIIERDRSTVREKKCLCDKCEEQRKNEIELANERIKLMRSFYAVMELKKTKTCAACGSEYHSQYPNQKYCSDKCKRKWRRGTSGYKKRAKKYGVKYERGITLMKVFDRDKGVCQICGKQCDWNDRSWNGVFGALYPTVDHITALANGGGHTWDNVQLAHAICNSYKRDLITA